MISKFFIVISAFNSFLSIFTGFAQHYTRDCEFGNFDKIKKQKQLKNKTKTTQKNTKTLAEFLFK